jgi:hypothetical protein
MLKAACFITGDDYSMVINDTPKSKRKISSLASLVLIPTFTWFFIGYIVGKVYLDFSLVPSFFIGLVIGMFIFIIERAIIMSNGNRKLVRFRYVIGILAAVLASIFIDDAFFHSDVQHRISSIKQEFIRGEEKKAGDMFNSQNDLVRIESEIKKQKSVYERLDNLAIAEAEGNSPTGQRGVGDVAKLKLSKAAEAKITYEKEQASLFLLYAQRDSVITKASEEAKRNFNENGFLIRIKALYQLVFSDWAVFFVYLIFTLLVGAFEFMVIQFKLNSEETNYEKRVKLIDEIGARRMQQLNNTNHPVYDGGLYLKEFNATRDLVGKKVGLYN